MPSLASLPPIEHGVFRLVLDESTCLQWGQPQNGAWTVVNQSPPTRSGSTFRTADVARPYTDGLTLGTDLRDDPVIEFSLAIQGDDTRTARRVVAEFEAIWADPRFRRASSPLATLIWNYDGELMQVQGRPRGFTITDETLRSVVKATAVFQVSAPAVGGTVVYGSTEFSRTYSQQTAPLNGGLEEMLVEPLGFGGVVFTPDSITVGGQTLTAPVIEFNGPILNPAFKVNGVFELKFNVNVQAGQKLTVDPARGTSVLSTGAFVGPARGSSRIGEVLLKPGTHTVLFSGIDPTGTATATVRWRNGVT